MMTIENIERAYETLKGEDLIFNMPSALMMELEILKARELRLIRMNLDRINENLTCVGDKQPAEDLTELRRKTEFKLCRHNFKADSCKGEIYWERILNLLNIPKEQWHETTMIHISLEKAVVQAFTVGYIKKLFETKIQQPEKESDVK